MRKGLLSILSIGAVAAAAALFTSPAGGQSEGETFASFEIIKDVHGDGPTSGYVIDYTCVDGQGGEVASGSLNYDNIVDGHESQEVFLSQPATCSIEETDSNGADLVEYECEFFGGTPPTAPTDDEGFDPGSCLDSQSAQLSTPGDFASFLVRNTFEADVLPDDEEPPPAVEPDVVAASPSFTG